MSTIPGVHYGPVPKAAQYARALTQWDLIVIHDTGHHGSGGSITSAADEAHYAATRTDDRSHWTSAHAYIDAGGPVGSLSLDLQAWAAFSWANGRGIHFEMCGENAGGVAAVPQATIAHTAALVRTVAALKGIPLVKLTPTQLGAAARNGTRVRGVCGHYDITVGLGVGDHDDPGPRFDWSAFIALADGAATITTQGDDMLTAEEHNWLMGCYFEGRNWAGAALTVASRVETSVATLAKVVETIAGKVDVDASELAAIQQSARTGAAAALATTAADIAAQVRAALADAGHEVDEATVEAAVRKVLDGATISAHSG